MTERPRCRPPGCPHACPHRRLHIPPLGGCHSRGAELHDGGRGAGLAAKAAEALKGAAKTETVAVHPVIVRHPATGEPGIYVNPYTTQRILGIPQDESEAIIERLADEMESMAYRWEHVWSVGDTLMWDNRGTLMHSGRIDYPLDQARRFIRTTVRGTPLAAYRLRADSVAA